MQMTVKVDCAISSKFTNFVMKTMLSGTTFSGHPTATSLFGTLRNISYVLFAIWRTDPILDMDKFLHMFRALYVLFCSGDDGVALAKTKQSA